MINSIRVKDVYAVRELVAKRHKYNTIISLYDPEYADHVYSIRELDQSAGNHTLYFAEFFEDIDEQCKGIHPDRLPTKENVENIIRYANQLKQSSIRRNILIHCHAGISRSTAAAIIFHYISGKTEAEAIKATFKDRKCMWPNQLLLKYADEILGSNLYNTIIIWKNAEKELSFSGVNAI